MTDPIQQHYLPKAAYLRFFENPKKPGTIYFYRRSEKPVPVNTEKVARERHLYSFVGDDGNYDFRVESLLADIENYAKPILEKLNYAVVPISLTYDEKGILSWFVAVQAVRTPTFRKTMQELYARITDVRLKFLGQHRDLLSARIQEIKNDQPERIDNDISVDEIQKFIQRGEYTLTSSGDYFLGLVFKLSEDIAPAVLIKKAGILRTEGINLVTSDYPVVLLPDPKTPPFIGSGFLMSDIIFPIGSQAALILYGEDESFFRPPDYNEILTVPCKAIRPFKARQINKLIIANAQKYLFMCEEDEAIQGIFDKTQEPKRLRFSHPFQSKD